MAEENPYPENRATCYLEKTKGLNPSNNNDPNPSISILQVLKDREIDGKFKKGSRIHTVWTPTVVRCFCYYHQRTHYF